MTSINPKVAAGTTAGALALLIVWLLSLFGVTMDATTAAALTVVIQAAAGYLKSDATYRGKHAPED